MKEQIYLVGHRGQPDSFPENSLESFSHALKSGAAYIETDINVTADGVAVLSHDNSLLRLTGKDINVTKSTYASFKDISAGYPEKFSSRFNHCRIATLGEFSNFLQSWPEVICFIEIKQDSLLCFGHRVVDLVMASLETIRDQTVLISFDYGALLYARDHYDVPVGWVLPEWSVENQLKADRLAPDYLFVDAEFCPDNNKELWPGPWQWAVYTINTLEEIKKYAALGIRIIETNRISELQQALSDSRPNDEHG